MTAPLRRLVPLGSRSELPLRRPDWETFVTPVERERGVGALDVGSADACALDGSALERALWRSRDRLGVTRLSMLTGLDAIGLPVAQATRPLALSNTVSQGRGHDAATARLGALMEAAELAAAETTAWEDIVIAPATAVEGSDAFVPAVALSERDGWRDRPRAWTRARDLVGGGTALVPVALVEADHALPDRHPDAAFARATTGLGAGADAVGALRHGLLETIEREAVDRARNAALPASALDLGPRAAWRSEWRDDPVGRRLVDLLAATERTGARVRGRLIGPLRASGSIHVAEMLVADARAGSGGAARPAAEGTAAAPCPLRAISSALEEAVQARASLAAGTRDDLTRDLYEPGRRPDTTGTASGLDDAIPPGLPIPFGPAVDAPPAQIDDLVAHCIALGARGVFAVPLLVDPVRVVRIVAPPLAIRLGRACG